jgi:hypothetical protein
MRRLLSRDGVLFLGSAALLTLVRLALLVIPFRASLHFVNWASGSRVARPHPPSAADINQVEWAVVKASRFVPGARHCLTRALVAKILFGKRGRCADLRIGVAKDEVGRLTAHAWLESGGVPVFGLTDGEVGKYSLLPQLDQA